MQTTFRCFYKLMDFVCDYFRVAKLPTEKCAVMIEAQSPEQRGYCSAYLMMNDPCFSTFVRCLDSQQLLAQFPT